MDKILLNIRMCTEDLNFIDCITFLSTLICMWIKYMCCSCASDVELDTQSPSLPHDVHFGVLGEVAFGSDVVSEI